MKDSLTSPTGREQFFLQLYQECLPDVAKYISKRGGSLSDAKDIFQDSLVAYYERVVSNDSNSPLNHKAYLFGVVKHLWYKRFHQQRLSSMIREDQSLDEIELSYQAGLEDEYKNIWEFLEKAGEKCMHLLKAFYYDQLNMTQLAKQFGYQSTRSATVQKYKCLEKVRDQVKLKSLQHEDFFG